MSVSFSKLSLARLPMAPQPATQTVPQPTFQGHTEDRFERLEAFHEELYDGFHAKDPKMVRRALTPDEVNSPVWLVGQALGQSTQRLSGIPYLKPNGKMASTGNQVEPFLNSFGYTLLPEKADSQEFKRIYATEVVKFFPGRPVDGYGDKKPKAKDITEGIELLKQEMDIATPRIMILLGGDATKAILGQDNVYRFDDDEMSTPFQHDGKLGSVIGQGFKLMFHGEPIYLFPINHPSGFSSAYEGQDAIRPLIKHVLDQDQGADPVCLYLV